MKTNITKIIGSLFFMLIMSSAMAQVPQALNYQAVARTITGDLIQNGPLGIRFNIRKGSVGGTIVYSEVHATITNNFGLFTLEIGKGTPVTGTFDTIAWGKNQYWLQVEMDPAGGVSYVNMGISQLLTVPYAMYAEKSGDVVTNYTNSAVPIAYGNINSAGTLSAGTSNISAVTWNASLSRYEITITGESYSTGTYVTIVTARANNYIGHTSSVGGNLLVYFTNISGTAVQTSFQFVTYKP